MSPFETIRERVLQDNLFSEGSGTFTIIEDEKHLQFDTSSPVWFIDKLDKRLESISNVLKHRKCADVAIWKRNNQHSWTLHIVEVKETVDISGSSRGWENIKRQFLGALIRCRMLAGIFGIRFDKVIFYTAFVTDNISIKGKPTQEDFDTENTSIYRLPDDVQPPWREWQDGRCRIYDTSWPDDYAKITFAHYQIPLEELTKTSKNPILL